MDKVALESILKENPQISQALSSLQDAVTKASKDKAQAAEILSEALGQPLYRPPTWSSKSNASYYQDKYASILKKSLQKMDPAKGDLLIRAKDFRISRRSLRELINQAWRYLIERDDESLKWKELRSEVEVAISPEGVILRWKRNAKINVEEEFVAHKQVDDYEWKKELDEFIANAEDGKKLVITELNLTEEQITYVNNIVDMTPGIFRLNVGMTRIELAKNLSLWNRMNA